MNMKRTYTLSLAFIIILGSTLAACSPGDAAPVGGDVNRYIAYLESHLPQWKDSYNVPGVAVALVHNDQVVWAKGFGVADVSRNQPVTTETLFRIASISKPATAWGVMRLVEQGQVDLDAPVEQYLTRWHFPQSGFDTNGITIRRLLSHTAGLSVEGQAEYDTRQSLPGLEDDLSGAGGAAWTVKIVQQPGTGFLYSSGGFAVLQLLIEEKTGQTFDTYMQERVFKPLGMTHSTYILSPEVQAALATGYDGLGNPLPARQFVSQGGGSLITTISDLAQFVAASMPSPDGQPAGRNVLTPETLELMFQAAPATENMMGVYGLGYVPEVLPNGVRIISHSGNITGWNAVMAFLPEKGEGFVILTNADTGYYFRDEVLGSWSTWAAGALPNDARFVVKLNKVLLAIAMTLGLLLALWIGLIVIQIRTGRRVLSWKADRSPAWSRLVHLGWPLIAAGIWGFFWYSSVPPQILFGMDNYLMFTFFTASFHWITLVICLWAVVLSIAAFIPRVPKAIKAGKFLNKPDGG